MIQMPRPLSHCFKQMSNQFTGNDAAALNLLKNWDYQAKSDSSAAAVFESFWSHLLSNTFDDDLPKKYWPDDSSQWNEVMRNLAKNPTDPFWDDKTTKNVVETRDDIIKKSWSEAVSELEGKYGSDMSKWSWGQMHTATFQNQTLGTTGIGLIDSLFNPRPLPCQRRKQHRQRHRLGKCRSGLHRDRSAVHAHDRGYEQLEQFAYGPHHRRIRSRVQQAL